MNAIDWSRPLPVQGTAALGRTHLALIAVLTLVCILTVWNPPAGRTSWALEVGPGLAYIAVLAAVWRRFPVSRLVAVGIFLHVLILVYGGVYTYARTPLGNWAREVFHLQRNHYDRVGHLALGFFPVLTIREVLLRRTPLQRGGWLTFLLLSVVLAVGAFWSSSSGGPPWWSRATPARPSSALRATSGTPSGTCSWPSSARRSRCRCCPKRTTARWPRSASIGRRCLQPTTKVSPSLESATPCSSMLHRSGLSARSAGLLLLMCTSALRGPITV